MCEDGMREMRCTALGQAGNDAPAKAATNLPPAPPYDSSSTRTVGSNIVTCFASCFVETQGALIHRAFEHAQYHQWMLAGSIGKESWVFMKFM